MKIIEIIRSFLISKRESRFWLNPDQWLAAIILDKDQVFARIKGNLALLERVPKPETGYFYRDIVYIEGPTGKQKYRDDEIDEYHVKDIYKKSDIPTFIFEALIPYPRDYFHLHDAFRGEQISVRFPWSTSEPNLNWRIGYCAAANIDMAKEILNNFVNSHEGAEVRRLRIS